MRSILLLALLLPLASVVGPPASAQGARLASADDGPLYHIVERLQRRGHLLGLNPTVAPHSHAELDRALAALDTSALVGPERQWAAWLRRAVPRPAGGTTLRLEAGAGLHATNNERLDALRWTTVADPTLALGAANLYPNAVLRGSAAQGPFAAQIAVHADVFYRDDPDGLDLVNKTLFLRNQEAYVAAEGRRLAAHLGNPARHWGLPSGEGLFISHNPRPYDGVAVRLGGERLALRSLAAELDAASPDGRMDGRPADFPRDALINRHLYAHRLDWRPRPWLVVSLQESMLTSGTGSGVSFGALLPTSVISMLNDTPPVNRANNGIVGGLLWVQRGAVTLSGQFALDDFDLFNRVEPASVAATGHFAVAGLAGGRADLTLDATAVTARAYNALLPEQGFVFARRGIGTAFSDYIHLRAGADLYLDDHLPGLLLRPEVHALWQGEATMHIPYPTNEVPLILVGDTERTLRAAVRAEFSPAPSAWVRADLGVNATANDGWIRDRQVLRFVGLVEAGMRWTFSRPLRLDL